MDDIHKIQNVVVLEDDDIRFKAMVSVLHRHIGTHIDIIRHADADSFINTIKDEKADIVFLDHDLGGHIYVKITDHNTGSEVVRFLIKHFSILKDVPFVIHSCNNDAAMSMIMNLHDGNRPAVYFPVTMWCDDNAWTRLAKWLATTNG